MLVGGRNSLEFRTFALSTKVIPPPVERALLSVIDTLVYIIEDPLLNTPPPKTAVLLEISVLSIAPSVSNSQYMPPPSRPELLLHN